VAVVLTPDGAHGPLGPGRSPLSGLFADGVDQMEAEIHFVATRERPGLKFGGTVDKVLDPDTGLAVGLRVFGDYSLRVADARAFVEKLAAGQGLTADQALTDWVRDLLLKVLRTDVAGHIGAQGWPILGIAAHTDDIERETLEKTQVALAGYGVEIVRMGNFVISMKDEDEALLTAQHARLAEAAVGTPPAVSCPACGHSNPAGSKFCGGCGKPLTVRCAACGTENPAGTAFCTSCGKQL
jgi:membrane protease subunit (stomatin/prohibitin family)